MSITIKPDDLSKAIMDELGKYDQNVQNLLKKEIKSVGRATAKTLRTTSPKRTGEYQKHWSSKVAYETTDEVRVAVYNKAPTYRLTHLLENGHATKNGGHVSGKSHIEPAQKEAEHKLLNRVKVGIRGC